MFRFFDKQSMESVVIAVALLCVMSWGCDRDEPASSNAVFEGLIIGMEARTLLDLESIEVADDVGTTLEFHAGRRRFVEFTPSHVREHMLQGLGVTVTYREGEDGILYIMSIRDQTP